MKQLNGRGEGMHVRSRNGDREDQALILVHAFMDFHSEIPLVALLGLVHLWIALPLFVLGGAGYCNQSGILDCALAHRHPTFAEVGFDGFKDLLAQIVLLHQVAEGQDRGLVRDAISDQFDAGKAAHGWRLNQGVFHCLIAQRIPLLQQLNPQHGGQ